MKVKKDHACSRQRCQNKTGMSAFSRNSTSLIVAILLALIFTATAATPPSPARKRSGRGVFIVHLDSKSGLTHSVTVGKSTGERRIDATIIKTLSKSRWKPGTVPSVKIPVSFLARADGNLELSF